ncbi:uncharacterized protein CELE_F08G2.4 [Caenorhabditis elegans]|uniref:Uncharacterized protein F08G2.4 n=1 Tax=Caenorhabditis elegans TaxID=6239 RepID=YS0I_CAEEL|nr:Uncharacterized protein CELE_F08G2.4 [Caenorhabditis elegans]Q9XVA4.1 RecName: Full=Uncharacterized protein F08G2.4 [Caenorhabditis elegans]AAG50226.1 2O123 [Caenorhabditis elegans]CAB04058.1 Uncharacterized protein CELE_F08G2.4 [Caenorhabditis elegans]|eukprot:NP_496900.1 Uncharacterized protein CELE_F08G2.4 [Caenorhabditis elegans]
MPDNHKDPPDFNNLEMKLEERIELSREDQDIQSTSSSYPHCEALDHIVSMESTYDFHRQMAHKDLQKHRQEYEKASEKILELRKKLTDWNMDPKKRKWIEDDLDSLVRKQESALSRIRLAEKCTKRDLRNDPPPAYQPDDPLKDLRKNFEKKEKPTWNDVEKKKNGVFEFH